MLRILPCPAPDCGPGATWRPTDSPAYAHVRLHTTPTPRSLTAAPELPGDPRTRQPRLTCGCTQPRSLNSNPRPRSYWRPTHSPAYAHVQPHMTLTQHEMCYCWLSGYRLDPGNPDP
ncbi:hypothetical protein BGX38DRAFT_102918 [Terfezia claveryi]|nr:hypothetical protein BGX38DRAFT_102918 [Terfezia claveryi]